MCLPCLGTAGRPTSGVRRWLVIGTSWLAPAHQAFDTIFRIGPPTRGNPTSCNGPGSRPTLIKLVMEGSSRLTRTPANRAPADQMPDCQWLQMPLHDQFD